MVNHNPEQDIKSDAEVARDIAFEVTYFPETSSLFEDQWVDEETNSVANNAALVGISYGRAVERMAILKALDMEPEKLESLLATVSQDADSNTSDLLAQEVTKGYKK
jgi:hypothetical protein